MSSVIVSRIQNKRGTQSQFNGHIYTPSGPNSTYPLGYTGVGGYGSFLNFNITNYPNVLLPGELALCTDTGHMYMGNLNAEYILVGSGAGTSLDALMPSEWVLPPSVVWATISHTVPAVASLEYTTTPFFSLLYSVTDNTLPGWNMPGPIFSRNGELSITAINDFVPMPNLPFPDKTSATLVDTHTEINMSGTHNLYFKAVQVGSLIQLQYMHNFPGNLKFSTSTISWAPF